MKRHCEPIANRVIVWATVVAIVVSQLSLPHISEAASLGSSTASAGSAAPPAAQTTQSFQPDLFTGRATTAIPIAVPPGRKGMQPSLALAYSSSARNGWLGVGWGLDVGYIERSTKNGVPKYNSTDTFTFMFQGVASDLVSIGGNEYRAKDEGLFLRFANNGVSGWEIRDKSGTRYLFGQTAASQVENLGSAFRWALDQVIDVNGNTITFSYTKDQGQLYLSQLKYTGHDPTSLAPANQVDFILESRPDVELSYRGGLPVTTAKRLKSIEARATIGAGLSLARRYDLAYALSRRTGRSLLASVTQVGTDGTTSLPATTLTYQENDAPSYAVSQNNPSVSTAAWNLRKAGLDTGHENFGCVTPYAGLPWQSPVVVTSSVDLGCLNAAVAGDGNLTVNGCQDHFMHAWTWVYVSSARSVSLSYTGAEACMYREDGGGVQQVGSGAPSSFSLQAGWSIIHLTGYHQHEGWTNTLTGSLKNQVDVMSASQFIKPQLAGDVNGDAISDLMTFDPSSGNTWTVALGQASGMSPGSTWLSGFGSASSTPLLGDWDGDGRTDIAVFNSGSWQFALSTGTGFQQAGYASPSLGGGTPFTGDFNGDGRIDVGVFNAGGWQVAINTGSGFAPTASFTLSWGAGGYEPLTGDFNGDGLTDLAIVNQSTGDVSVALSDGRRFVTAGFAQTAAFGPGQNHLTSDVNGDGLTDVGYYDKSTGQIRYVPSAGVQFGAAAALPLTFTRRGPDDNPQVGDFNGDGLPDPAVFNANTGASELATSQGSFPDLLSGIANGLGGSTALQYQRSSTCDNMCPIQHVPTLPFVIPVVNRVTVSDGMGRSYFTTYVYEQGRYDAPSKEFRGFARVKVRDAEANVTITEFLQEDATRGRPLRTQAQDAFGNLWTKQEHVWSVANPQPGVNFVRLDQTDTFTYDGDATFRQVRSRFNYDAYGNLTTASEDGEPGVLGDERSTVTAYAANTVDWILNKPSLTQTLDASGAAVAQRRFTYDAKGHLTKEEEWLNASPERWLATTLTYDAYGNVAAITDALGRATTNTYDATGTYLTQIANAKGHTRTLAYDARLGQVTSSTDQNSVTTTTEYDALGRVAKVIGPTDTSALPTISYEYDLSTVPSRTVTHARLTSGGADELTSYAFTDGLGRTIQTRSPAEDATKQIVAGAVELNTRGLAVKQWVPYLDPLSTQYVPPPTASLAPPVQYDYDPVGRLIKTTNPDGSITSAAYDDWSATLTDANGHQTRRTQDAFGRLLQVEELNGGETYTTAYAYDPLGNLTKVTDAKGNITRIAYDSLGRKLSMDDPDMHHWTYAYDDVDNLTSQTDARGVTIAFTYDALNRLTQKSYTLPTASSLQPTAPVSYTYDDPTKPFAKGKLTGITDGSGSSSFEYDTLGRLIKETKAIDATSYTVSRSYDLLGRLVSLTYPDNDVVSYTYNAQGGIETITSRGADEPTSQTIVSNIDYNAAGQLTKITYGNGVTSDYSYDPLTLRLAGLKTQDSGLKTLQDFSYQFDAIGNVTAIQDAVHTATQSFQYDNLSRLTQAAGAYGTYTYAYDPIGNMLEKEGVTMRYGENGAGPHAVTATSSSSAGGSSALQMSYDADGNMVSKTPDGEIGALLAQTYAYDADNRLVRVDTPQAESVSVTFHPGWNFFSLPVIPDDARISSIFPTFAQDFEQIARFVPASTLQPPTSEHFEHYVGNPKFDDVSELEYGVGYQVYCKSAADVTIAIKGKYPSKKLSKSLTAGWFLLPAIVTQTAAASTVLAGLTYDQVLDVNLQPVTQVNPAQAYYVHLTAAGTFSPSLPRSPTTQFVYDGDGGKVKQTTASGTTTYLGEAYEKDPAGKTTKYIFAGSLRLAAKDSIGALRFYHGDHLGSSDVVTDGTGAMVEHTEHTPYGSVSAHSPQPPAPSVFGFTGQRQDSTTGLILFPARAYDPQLGRFIQPDTIVQSPSDPQTLNRYSYVRNNPVNLVDPSGHFLKKLFEKIAESIKSWFSPFTDPEPTSLSWWTEVTGRIIPIFVSRKAIQETQQGLQAANQYLINQLGFSSAGANAAIAGILGFAMTGGNPIAGVVAATGAYATSKTMETKAAQRTVESLAESLINFGVSPDAAYMASAQIVGFGVGMVIGLSVGVAAQSIESGLSRFEGLQTRGFYPPNRGFSGPIRKTTLQPGSVIDLYGDTEGSFASPAGTPIQQRSLPPGVGNEPLRTFRVVKPLTVDSGKTAAWFEQDGGGTQYDFGKISIQRLIDSGHLEEVK